MPNRCDVLDKKPSRGHSVSHSNIKSKRSWRVNTHKRRRRGCRARYRVTSALEQSRR
ncbi:MAG: hypothetical protein EBZ46_04680 [Actinobacteria bacterium]|nr:hypothetical protein [Actinomycetota bacterium]